MRRTLSTIVFMTLLLQVAAREFYPMLKDKKEWRYYLTNSFVEHNLYYRLDGDTIIDGEKGYKVWSKLVDQQTGQVRWDEALVGAMIEKEGRTYYIERNGRRRLICDLNMNVGEMTADKTQRVAAIDEIYVMGRVLRRMEIEFSSKVGWESGGYWVEGVGGLYRFPDFDSPTQLVSCYEDGRCLFTNVEFTYMPAVRLEPAAVPLLEEGKIWWYDDYIWSEMPREFRMFVNGDTIANGKSWKKLYHDHTVGGVPFFAKALREDGGRVYKLEEDNSESLVFDFTLDIGDRYTPDSRDGRYMEVIAVDTMLTEGVSHRRLILQQYVGGVATDLTCWIEGIGSDYGIDLTAFWSVYDSKVSEKGEEEKYNYLFFECDDASGQCIYSNRWKPNSVSQPVTSVQIKSTSASTCFDLQGRRLTQKPAKGVYIQDGKKVVVR